MQEETGIADDQIIIAESVKRQIVRRKPQSLSKKAVTLFLQKIRIWKVF